MNYKQIEILPEDELKAWKILFYAKESIRCMIGSRYIVPNKYLEILKESGIRFKEIKEEKNKCELKLCEEKATHIIKDKLATCQVCDKHFESYKRVQKGNKGW